jgi:enoyl-CoA hydratase/carnithine racemase
MGIRTERHGRAAVVIIDYPERRNALGPDAARELMTALTDATADPEVAGVVITGEGAFSAGGDTKGMASRVGMSPEERRTLVYSAYQGLLTTLMDMPVPTVAAIDGAAIGFGFDIALGCDSRFIGPDGWVMQGWGRLGLVAGSGGVLLLQVRAPGSLWRLLEGQPRVDGPTAERLGLAEAVPTGTARERAIARVNAYGEMPRATLEAYVALDRAELKRQLTEHLPKVLDLQLPLLQSQDFVNRLNPK